MRTSKATKRTREAYLSYLCSLVGLDNRDGKSYMILAHLLHDKDYYWTLPMDENRAYDGIALRNRWYTLVKDAKMPDGETPRYSYDALSRTCSVFEMMVALAVRCDEAIMWDKSKGDRTAQWFWCMIENLGFTEYSDDSILVDASNIISTTIQNALDRTYEYDGLGGFWPVKNPTRDQREVELWYQMCSYLEERFPNH